MVRPNDIIGCDWDGTVVIPIEIVEEVLAIAARIAVDDKKARRRLYDKSARKPDEPWIGNPRRSTTKTCSNPEQAADHDLPFRPQPPKRRLPGSNRLPG